MPSRAAFTRALLAIATLTGLAGAFVGGNIATSTEARADWYCHQNYGPCVSSRAPTIHEACQSFEALWGIPLAKIVKGTGPDNGYQCILTYNQYITYEAWTSPR